MVKYSAGDRVRIKSSTEIAATLDESGRLEGGAPAYSNGAVLGY